MARAVVISRYGGPEVLEVVEIPIPATPPDGVLIEVRAAGVNPVDTKIRAGRRASQPLAARRRARHSDVQRLGAGAADPRRTGATGRRGPGRRRGGRGRPVQLEIDSVYPLDQAAEAHRGSETGHVRGKIVLVP